MDVVLIFNGLGNQMSQYAFYLHKRKISNSTRFLFSKKSSKIHNGYELDSVFGIKNHDSLSSKILYLIFSIVGYKKYTWISKPVIGIFNFMGIAIINENDDYNFKPEYLQPSRGIKFYVGGWHSEKYFIDIKDQVLNAFQFHEEKMGKENLDVLERIKTSKSVSVHVRRGDFMDSNNYDKLGAVCTINYFLTAIEKMKSLIDNPHFFFFTNDHSWVKTHFNEPGFTIVNLNTKTNNWKDMVLISNCTHHINSNGSFSWWSSWLNTNQNSFVVVPKNFIVNRHFEDIYPEHWIQLSDY
jgi:Glycosyl transferase family 11